MRGLAPASGTTLARMVSLKVPAGARVRALLTLSDDVRDARRILGLRA